MSRIVRPRAVVANVESVGAYEAVGRADPPITPRSRLDARKMVNPVELVPQNNPYGWVEPPVWTNGVKYPAEYLDDQFIENLEQVPRALLTVTEPITVTFPVSNTFTAIPGLVWPLAAGETWLFLWALVVGTSNQWQPAIQVPNDSVVGAHYTYRDSSTGATVSDQWLEYGGRPKETWANWQSFVQDQGSSGIVLPQIIITATNGGNVEFSVNSYVNDSEIVVLQGTTVLGMRLFP